MPKPLDKDRNLARDLYLRGIPKDAIALKIGVNKLTLGTWIRRGGWVKAKSVVAETVTQEIRQPLLTSKLHDNSIALREGLAEKLAQALLVVKSSPVPRTLGQMEKQMNQISGLLEHGSRLFNWQNSQTLSIINSRRISEFEPLPPDAATAPSVPVEASGDVKATEE